MFTKYILFWTQKVYIYQTYPNYIRLEPSTLDRLHTQQTDGTKTKLTIKNEMQRAFLEINATNFNQAAGTTFATQPSNTIIPPLLRQHWNFNQTLSTKRWCSYLWD